MSVELIGVEMDYVDDDDDDDDEDYFKRRMNDQTLSRAFLRIIALTTG